ncbi:hypothetical protein NYP18_09030 [Corynebacterium sp. YIM 101645]|uniref:Exonuclease domain-containing protein n=1 Tax=Corynebacterium lemuris TaxID=1859292 RepID=A0ABT2FX40_9CORY|nr:hypothetical protein [Corynebacterium lemuris]MCS5479802.1 hypothetical protein [Corynebacterium lemuris]
MTPALLGFDCETTGLDPHGAPPAGLLEVGMVAFTEDLTPICQWSSLVMSPAALGHLAAGPIDQVVEKMHAENGLFDEIFELIPYAPAELFAPGAVAQKALAWMAENDIPRGLPMLGSSVTLDRTFLAKEMPALLDAFHYRSVDASSVRLAAELAAGVTVDVPEGLPAHRVIADIHASARLVRSSLDAIRGAA